MDWSGRKKWASVAVFKDFKEYTAFTEIYFYRICILKQCRPLNIAAADQLTMYVTWHVFMHLQHVIAFRIGTEKRLLLFKELNFGVTNAIKQQYRLYNSLVFWGLNLLGFIIYETSLKYNTIQQSKTKQSKAMIEASQVSTEH